MRTKKLLGIGLGCLLLFSLVGFGSATAAQSQSETSPPFPWKKNFCAKPGKMDCSLALMVKAGYLSRSMEKKSPKLTGGLLPNMKTG